jgi:hypothetical protein
MFSITPVYSRKRNIDTTAAVLASNIQAKTDNVDTKKRRSHMRNSSDQGEYLEKGVLHSV